MKIIREEDNDSLEIDLNETSFEMINNDLKEKYNLTNDSNVRMSIKSDDTWYALKELSNFIETNQAKE